MDVKELLRDLENDLGKAKEKITICERDYNYAIDAYLDRGTVTYFYAQYEKSLKELDKIQSAINIIREKMKGV